MPKHTLEDVDDVTGQSRKTLGRPLGAKNKKAEGLLIEAVRHSSEIIIAKSLVKIIEKCCELAEQGNLQATKILLDRIIPPKRSVELSTKDEGGLKVNITVENLVTHAVKEDIEAEIEDAEVIETKGESNG